VLFSYYETQWGGRICWGAALYQNTRPSIKTAAGYYPLIAGFSYSMCFQTMSLKRKNTGLFSGVEVYMEMAGYVAEGGVSPRPLAHTACFGMVQSDGTSGDCGLKILKKL
jgi:hypothetical protein